MNLPKPINNKVAWRAWWRNLDPVWRWNTAESRKLWEHSKQFPLSVPAVEELKKTGVSIRDDFLASGDLETFIAYKDSVQKKYANPLKPFLIEYIPTAGVLDFDSPIIRFALSERVLNTVSGYLGCWARLYDVRLWETKITQQNQKLVYSQKFHRDPENSRLINCFVYLTDVLDSGAGPFIIIPESHKGGKYEKVFPQLLPPLASYPPEGAVEKFFPQEKIKTCFGRAGTVIFADTCSIHKGGISTITSRIMLKLLYTDAGMFKGDHTRYSLPKYPPANLTEQQKYAVGLLS